MNNEPWNSPFEDLLGLLFLAALLALVVYATMRGDAPDVELVPTGFTPVMTCKQGAKPRCWKAYEVPTGYEWRNG